MTLEVIYQPSEPKIYLKVGLLNPKTIPKQLLNNSKTTLKSPENWFLDPEIGQNGTLRRQNLTLIFDFRGHISAFRAENTAKSGSFKVKNNG